MRFIQQLAWRGVETGESDASREDPVCLHQLDKIANKTKQVQSFGGQMKWWSAMPLYSVSVSLYARSRQNFLGMKGRMIEANRLFQFGCWLVTNREQLLVVGSLEDLRWWRHLHQFASHVHNVSPTLPILLLQICVVFQNIESVVHRFSWLKVFWCHFCTQNGHQKLTSKQGGIEKDGDGCHLDHNLLLPV